MVAMADCWDLKNKKSEVGKGHEVRSLGRVARPREVVRRDEK